jgi:hypothetical protein
MGALLTRLGRLERGNERCPGCGFPDNEVLLRLIEVVVETAEQLKALPKKNSRLGPFEEYAPCPECGNWPGVAAVLWEDT